MALVERHNSIWYAEVTFYSSAFRLDLSSGNDISHQLIINFNGKCFSFVINLFSGSWQTVV